MDLHILVDATVDDFVDLGLNRAGVVRSGCTRGPVKVAEIQLSFNARVLCYSEHLKRGKVLKHMLCKTCHIRICIKDYSLKTGPSNLRSDFEEGTVVPPEDSLFIRFSRCCFFMDFSRLKITSVRHILVASV